MNVLVLFNMRQEKVLSFSFAVIVLLNIHLCATCEIKLTQGKPSLFYLRQKTLQICFHCSVQTFPMIEFH